MGGREGRGGTSFELSDHLAARFVNESKQHFWFSFLVKERNQAYPFPSLSIYTSHKQTSVCICTGHIAVFGVYYRQGFFVWHEEHVEGYKIYRCLYNGYLSPTQGTIRRYNRHKIWVKPHSETSYGFLAPGPQYRLDHNWNIIYQFTKQISSITILLNQYMVNYGRDISFCMISIKLLKFYYIGKS